MNFRCSSLKKEKIMKQKVLKAEQACTHFISVSGACIGNKTISCVALQIDWSQNETKVVVDNNLKIILL